MKIFDLKDVSEIDRFRDKIRISVRSDGFALLRGLFDPYDIEAARKAVLAKVNQGRLVGTTAGSRETPRTNSLKWSVGGSSGAQPGNARLMVSIYNPNFADDIYHFKKNFQRLIQVRDAIRGDGQHTTDENLPEECFNACRFQLYPKGGGFMLGHRDTVAEATSNLANIELLQLLIVMTKRGQHYSEGGAYVIHRDGVVDIDAYTQQGDVVVYDGRSFHGVGDIDPESPLSTTQLDGRLVALVTVYN
jgi:hypothetical protein